MFKDELIKFSIAVRESTLKRLYKVPEGYENWKFVENSLTIAEIAKHLIDCDSWLFEKISNESLKSTVPETNSYRVNYRTEFETLCDELKNTQRKREQLIKNMIAKDFSRKIFDDRFDDKVTIWWIIVRGNLDHEIHHRGQIALYLKLLKAEHKNL